MPWNESPPFPRGETYYNGRTIDSNALEGANLEGKEYTFPDLDLATAGGARASRSNREVRCRVVRNSAGIALLPKRVVKYKTSTYGYQVDGYTAVTSEDFAGVVDEWLPTTGVPSNDLFYIVIQGPTVALTDIAASAANLVSQGSLLVALTAVTSQATTAGHVTVATAIAAATTDNDGTVFDQAVNRIGRALSAKTTNNTNADIYVDLRAW